MKPKVEKEIQKALDRFPSIVKKKREQFKKRQAFLKKTFGDLVKQIRKEEKRLEKKLKLKN